MNMTPAELRTWMRWAETGQLARYLRMNLREYRQALAEAGEG